MEKRIEVISPLHQRSTGSRHDAAQLYQIHSDEQWYFAAWHRVW
jgi:hypothetical protein